MSARTIVTLAGAALLVTVLLFAAVWWLAAHPALLLPLLSTRLPPELKISEVHGLALRASGGDIARAAFTLEGNAVEVQELSWRWRVDGLWPLRIAPQEVRAHSVHLRLAAKAEPAPLPRRPLPRFWETAYWPTVAALRLGVERLGVSDDAGNALLEGSIETGADSRSGRVRARIAGTGNELLLQWQRSHEAQWVIDWQSGTPYLAEGRLVLSASASGADWTLQAASPGATLLDRRFERIALEGSGTADLFEGTGSLLSGRFRFEGSMPAEAGALAWQGEAAVATAQDLGTVIELERITGRQGTATLSATPALEMVLDAQGMPQSVSVGAGRIELRGARQADWRITELAIDFPAAPLWRRDSGSWVLPTCGYQLLAANPALEVSLKSTGRIRKTRLEPEGRQSTRLSGRIDARHAQQTVTPLDYELALDLVAGAASSDGWLAAPAMGRLASFRTRTEFATGASSLHARIDSSSWKWGKGLLHTLLGPKQSLMAGDLLDAALKLDIAAAFGPKQRSARISGVVERASGMFRGTGISGLAISPFELIYRDDALLSALPLSWRLEALNAGVTFNGLSGELILDDDGWRLRDVQGALFGGAFSVSELGQIEREGPLGTIRLEGIDLARVVALLNNPDITVTGRIDGDIPLFVEGGALTVHGGRLRSSEGGIIRYRPAAAAASPSNSQIALVRDALSNLVFDSLSAGVEYAASGELVLTTEIRGRNPDLHRTRPVHLNLTVEDNILTLMRSLRAGNRINDWVGRRIEERRR